MTEELKNPVSSPRNDDAEDPSAVSVKRFEAKPPANLPPTEVS